MAKRKTATRSGSKSKRGSGRRETIATGTDRRYVRREGRGRFKESDDVGRSLRRDVATKAKKKVKVGYGDRGDRARR